MGVTLDKKTGKFRVRVYKEGRTFQVGYFRSEPVAIRALKSAKRRMGNPLFAMGYELANKPMFNISEKKLLQKSRSKGVASTWLSQKSKQAVAKLRKLKALQR